MDESNFGSLSQVSQVKDFHLSGYAVHQYIRDIAVKNIYNALICSTIFDFVFHRLVKVIGQLLQTFSTRLQPDSALEPFKVTD